MTNQKHTTREGWLNEAAAELAAHITNTTGMAVPRIIVSPGWPSKGGPEGRVLGECWASEMTKEGAAHIFLSPLFDDGDAVRLMDALLHEMLHTTCDNHYGKRCAHGPEFTKAVRAVGLAGKPTATYAEEGSELWAYLDGVHAQLGVYPTAKIEMEEGLLRSIKKGMAPGAKIDKSKAKRKSGHWVKFESKTLEGYIVRVSPVALREHGVPKDPTGEDMRCVDKRYDKRGNPKA